MAKKVKKYKLGSKAGLYVDSGTGIKVLPGKHVEFEAKHKTDKFQKAVKNGHLVEVEDGEVEGQTSTKTELISIAEFSKLKVEDRKKYILEKFKDEDEEEINDLKGADLDAKYEELLEDDDEDDDEDEE